MSMLSFFRRSRQASSADTAKDRLQILLSHERTDRSSPDYLPMLQRDILDVVQRCPQVDRSADGNIFDRLFVTGDLRKPLDRLLHLLRTQTAAEQNLQIDGSVGTPLSQQLFQDPRNACHLILRRFHNQSTPMPVGSLLPLLIL
jgi:cell division topological specificity factor MinE